MCIVKVIHTLKFSVNKLCLRVEICFAFNVNEIWLICITLYLISPICNLICNVKELIKDKPHKDRKECRIVGFSKLLILQIYNKLQLLINKGIYL